MPLPQLFPPIHTNCPLLHNRIKAHEEAAMRTARGAMRKAAGKDFYADLTLHSIKGITEYGN